MASPEFEPVVDPADLPADGMEIPSPDGLQAALEQMKAKMPPIEKM